MLLNTESINFKSNCDLYRSRDISFDELTNFDVTPRITSHQFEQQNRTHTSVPNPSYQNPRIHSTFRQISCATGRIVSHSPNVMCIAKDFEIPSPNKHTLASLLSFQNVFGRTADLLAPFIQTYDSEVPSTESIWVIVRKPNGSSAEGVPNLRHGKLKKIISDRNILCGFGTSNNSDHEIGCNGSLLDYWISREVESDYGSKSERELSEILQVEVQLTSDQWSKEDRNNNDGGDGIVLTYPMDRVWVVETPEIRSFLPPVEDVKDKDEICLRRIVSVDSGWSLLDVDYGQLEVR